VAWELLKEDVRHKLGHLAVDESGIGNAEDKVNKIKNKTLGRSGICETPKPVI